MNSILGKLFYLLAFISIILGIYFSMENAQLRLPHADESEQASTAQNLLDGKGYIYNPNGPHGPTLYYYTLFDKYFGKRLDTPTILDLRKSLIIFSAIIMLGYLFLGFVFGGYLSWGACAFFSMAAIPIIYSVYYVHEIIFATTILFTAISAWMFYRYPKSITAVALGFFAGLAQSTKETSVLMFAGIFTAILFDFILFEKDNRKEIFYGIVKNLYKSLGIFFAVCFLFYSSFGENPKGILDAFDCYISHFLGKAQSAEHSAPFYYYLQLLTLQKSEGVWFGEIILSIFFMVGFLLSVINIKQELKDKTKLSNLTKVKLTTSYKERTARFIFFISISSVTSIVILSFISYKTPWLLLPIITLMCIVCAYGVSYFGKSFKPKGIITSTCIESTNLIKLPNANFYLSSSNKAQKNSIGIRLLVFALCVIALYFQYKSNKLSCVRFHSDPRNPFIYSHTVPDFKNLVSRIEQSVAKSKYNKDIPIAIVTQSSPWPLPYYTRNMQNVGYYSSIPQNLNVFEIVIADYSTETELSKYLPETEYQTEYFGLRKNLPLKIFIKKELFNKIISDE